MTTDSSAAICWLVSFVAYEKASKGGNVTKPEGIIDASTGEVIAEWNAINFIDASIEAAGGPTSRGIGLTPIVVM